MLVATGSTFVVAGTNHAVKVPVEGSKSLARSGLPGIHSVSTSVGLTFGVTSGPTNNATHGSIPLFALIAHVPMSTGTGTVAGAPYVKGGPLLVRKTPALVPTTVSALLATLMLSNATPRGG